LSSPKGTPDIVVAHTEQRRIGINYSEMGGERGLKMKQHNRHKFYELSPEIKCLRYENARIVVNIFK